MANNKTESILDIKCPECGAIPKKLAEVWTGVGLVYELDEKGNIVDSIVPGALEPTSTVYATCSHCKHTWDIKKYTSTIKEVEHWETNAKETGNGWRAMDKKDYLNK